MNLGKCCSDGKSVFCADFSVKYIRTHSALFFIRYGLAVKNGGDFDERGKQRTGICPWILLFQRYEALRPLSLVPMCCMGSYGLCGLCGWKPCRVVLLAQRMYGRLRTGLIRRRRGRLE